MSVGLHFRILRPGQRQSSVDHLSEDGKNLRNFYSVPRPRCLWLPSDRRSFRTLSSPPSHYLTRGCLYTVAALHGGRTIRARSRGEKRGVGKKRGVSHTAQPSDQRPDDGLTMIEKEIGYVISHEESHYAARARRVLAVLRRESVR